MNNTIKLMTFGLAISVLQACTTVGPDYENPNIDQMTVSIDQQSDIVEREAKWWQHFNDPQFDKIVDLAIGNNLSLKMATENVKKSFAVFDDVDNDNLPVASLEATYTNQDQVTPGFSESRTNLRTYELGASLSWSADLFGKIERSRQAAQANTEAALFALRDLQVGIISQAVQAYGDLKGLKSRIIILKKNIGIVEQTKSIVQSRYEEGFASSLDLKRIEAQYYNALANLPAFEASYQRTRNYLEALLGSKEPLPIFAFDALSQHKLSLNEPFAIGNASEFLRKRADVHRAERKLAMASAEIGANVADLYPDINVSGFIGFLTGDLSNLGSGTEAWRVAPSLSWNILDYGSINARIKIAKAEERTAYFEFHETILNAIKEVDTSLNTHTNIQKRQQFLAAQLDASREAHSLARELYESGEIGLLDLLDAERSVLNIEDEFVVSNIESFSSIVDVYSAFGGGLYTQQDNTTI